MSFSSNLNHYGMVHVASVSDVLLDTSFTPPCQRMGAMVAFRSFQDFTRCVLLLLAPLDCRTDKQNGMCFFVLMMFVFTRNIKDVLSCFSDSPPTSPTFPEGGNPVLYGEEDNKVRGKDLCHLFWMTSDWQMLPFASYTEIKKGKTWMHECKRFLSILNQFAIFMTHQLCRANVSWFNQWILTLTDSRFTVLLFRRWCILEKLSYLVWSFLVAAILVTSWQVFFFSLSWICSVSLGSSDSLLLFQIEVYRWYETAKGVHCNYRLIMLSFHQIVLSLIVGILLILHIKLQTVCTLCNISM